jgi:transcriptional regulator with XRE-family HTH domain
MDLKDNIISFIKTKDPEIICREIAFRAKERRLEQELTQRGLSEKAGITLASYRRFERTGEISFKSIVMIGIALNAIDDFTSLFSTKTYLSIDDILNKKNITRQRGRRISVTSQ